MDIFSTGHDGIGTLIPSFYAIDCIVNNESEKDYQKLSQHLRRSIVCILGSHLVMRHYRILIGGFGQHSINKEFDRDHVDTSVNDSKKRHNH